MFASGLCGAYGAMLGLMGAKVVSAARGLYGLIRKRVDVFCGEALSACFFVNLFLSVFCWRLETCT